MGGKLHNLLDLITVNGGNVQRSTVATSANYF